MAKRRSPNEGAVYQRKDGRWVGAITLGYEGERRKRRVFYGRNKQEVREKVRAAQRKLDEGSTLPSDRLKLGAYLQQWLKAVKPSLRPNTFRRYEQYVHLHITPKLGRMPLTKLTAGDLQALYADRLDAGLSPTTVRHLHMLVHKALSQAMRWNLCTWNVADLVDAPRRGRQEMGTLNAEQAQALIAAAAGERLGAAIILAVTTGMRRGEILGLHWRDVDLEHGSAYVRTSLQWVKGGPVFAEPKTAKSRRQVVLTRVAVEALRAHRLAQTEERLRRGAVWQDQDLVFANEIGGPVEPHNFIRRTVKRTLKAAGLPSIRFHDLRHTAATLLLGQGVHPKLVSEMLGHADIGTTLNLYSHVTPAMHGQAAAAMDAILGTG